jgi:hypothetical protein
MEEQRIKNLEEELKVLKNQIRAVLLDIKEQLATGGNGHSSQQSVPPWESGTPAAAPHQQSDVGVASKIAGGADKGFAEPGPDSGIAEDIRPSLKSFLGLAQKASPATTEKASLASGDSNGEGRVDLLTISVLAQWLSRAAATVSKDQLGKLVEIYDITGNLPPRLKQAIILLADLDGDGNKAEDAEDVPAAVSLQLLIELDSLLRYRTGALESVVLSMILDKGQNSRRGG